MLRSYEGDRAVATRWLSITNVVWLKQHTERENISTNAYGHGTFTLPNVSNAEVQSLNKESINQCITNNQPFLSRVCDTLRTNV